RGRRDKQPVTRRAYDGPVLVDVGQRLVCPRRTGRVRDHARGLVRPFVGAERRRLGRRARVGRGGNELLVTRAVRDLHAVRGRDAVGGAGRSGDYVRVRGERAVRRRIEARLDVVERKRQELLVVLHRIGHRRLALPGDPRVLGRDRRRVRQRRHHYEEDHQGDGHLDQREAAFVLMDETAIAQPPVELAHPVVNRLVTGTT